MKVLLTLDESSWFDVHHQGYKYTEVDDKIQVELDHIKYDPNHYYSKYEDQLCDHYSLNPDDIFWIEDLKTD